MGDVSDLLPQLIRAATAGDQRAFAALHARYARMVHAILLARLPASEAEDQVQEVFLVAWKKMAQLADPAGFGAWLGTIARNRAVDAHRRRHPTEALHDSWPHASDSGAASASDRAEVRHVLDAIRGLPESYRETLVMRLCEGMSGPEISTVTGLEPGSVRINLHRGMKLLRDKLGIDRKVAARE